MPVYPYRGTFPEIHPTAFVHPDAVVIGDVHIGPDSSVWPGVVIRGDVNFIRIGARTSIQDGSVVHVSRPSEASPQGYPTLIGNDIVVGHKVVLHGCRLEDSCLIGIGAIVLDNASVGRDSIVGAGSLLTPGKDVPEGTMWMGSPARQLRTTSEAERQSIRATAENYRRLATQYRLAHGGQEEEVQD
ncbi:MAG: gamma carbonic anhydrase family protein [Magnetococcales bacterium]|nr:gamma carbonic anhydrase family protein [Magnetococcales bacterium]